MTPALEWVQSQHHCPNDKRVVAKPLTKEFIEQVQNDAIASVSADRDNLHGMLAECRKENQHLLSQVAEAKREVERLLEPMPGALMCNKCGFVLQKNILFTKSCTIRAENSPLNERCPNDGSLMRPFTWREANEAYAKRCSELMDENNESGKFLLMSDKQQDQVVFELYAMIANQGKPFRTKDTLEFAKLMLICASQNLSLAIKRAKINHP